MQARRSSQMSQVSQRSKYEAMSEKELDQQLSKAMARQSVDRKKVEVVLNNKAPQTQRNNQN